jgi:hypothetical protein
VDVYFQKNIDKVRDSEDSFIGGILCVPEERFLDILIDKDVHYVLHCKILAYCDNLKYARNMKKYLVVSGEAIV